MRLKGGTLLYTLLILLIIGVVMGALLLRFQMYNELLTTISSRVQANENAISAVNYFLAVDSDKKGEAKGTLFHTKTDSFYIQTQEWGIYRLLKVKAKAGKALAEKVCLVGMQPTENLQAAIYLNDNHQPLKITGHTTIKGDVYLPESGVQAGNVGNIYFEGDTLVDGKINKSKSESLNINYKNIRNNFHFIQQLSSSNSIPTNSVFDIKYYQYHDARLIANEIPPLSCITSSNYLEIAPSANLNLCVLYAPTVKIRAGFTGCVQVLATDSIIIDEDVHLEYPSCLVLSNNNNNMGVLKINTNSKIEGCVLNDTRILNQITSNNNYSLLEKNSYVKGLFITNGNTELLGNVMGLIATNNFYLKTPTAVYTNYLLSSEVNASLLSKNFSCGIFVSSNPNYRVITWLK